MVEEGVEQVGLGMWQWPQSWSLQSLTTSQALSICDPAQSSTTTSNSRERLYIDKRLTDTGHADHTKRQIVNIRIRKVKAI